MRKHRMLTVISVLVLAVFVLLALGSGSEEESPAETVEDAAPPEVIEQDDEDDDPLQETEQDEEIDLSEPSFEPTVTFGPGTYLVNDDIEPGRYRSESGVTYFERLSGLSGEFDDIIANAALPSGPVIVDIKSSDMAFKTEGSGTWYLLDDSYQPEVKTTFSDGWWIVGVDIEPGNYRTQDDVQYWARLSGFSHGFGDIIANGAMVTGGTIIEISSSDAGFETQGGASWTKID